MGALSDDKKDPFIAPHHSKSELVFENKYPTPTAPNHNRYGIYILKRIHQSTMASIRTSGIIIFLVLVLTIVGINLVDAAHSWMMSSSNEEGVINDLTSKKDNIDEKIPSLITSNFRKLNDEVIDSRDDENYAKFKDSISLSKYLFFSSYNFYFDIMLLRLGHRLPQLSFNFDIF